MNVRRCGEQDVPAVYADVASASCWIDTQVRCFQLQFQYHQVGVLFKCLMEAHSVAGPVFVWIVLMG